MKVVVVSHASANLRQRLFFNELANHCNVLSLAPLQWNNEKLTDFPFARKFEEFGSQPTDFDMFNYTFPVTPHFIYDMNPDIVYCMEEPWSFQAWLTVMAAKTAGKKVGIFTWQNIPIQLPPHLQNIEEVVVNSVDFMVFGNKEAQRIYFAKRAMPNILLPQVGIETSLFKPSENTSIKRKLLFVGRMVENKGVLDILHAVNMLTDIENLSISFLGDGELHKHISDNIKIPAEVLPRQPYEKLYEIYQKHNILLCPSQMTQGWVEQYAPFSSHEGQSCGLNVITTPTGAIPFWNEGRVAYVPEKNAERLAEVIRSFVDKEIDPKRWDFIDANFSNRVVAEKLASFFKVI